MLSKIERLRALDNQQRSIQELREQLMRNLETGSRSSRSSRKSETSRAEEDGLKMKTMTVQAQVEPPPKINASPLHHEQPQPMQSHFSERQQAFDNVLCSDCQNSVFWKQGFAGFSPSSATQDSDGRFLEPEDFINLLNPISDLSKFPVADLRISLHELITLVTVVNAPLPDREVWKLHWLAGWLQDCVLHFQFQLLALQFDISGFQLELKNAGSDTSTLGLKQRASRTQNSTSKNPLPDHSKFLVPYLRIPVHELITPIPVVSAPLPDISSPVRHLRIPVRELKNAGTDRTNPVPDLKTPIPELNTKVPERNTVVPDVSNPVLDLRLSVPELIIPVPGLRVPLPELSSTTEKCGSKSYIFSS
ncbi:hypothetical protein GE061_018490 [Apolygus lucorum]|uniref:Uncharacterized protein n=1 Tax=Apolygus lucorum TaxID=248454 RepID=A0A8S9XFC7_APOLU|nr:hypothetical protein GE061_018490 [Apolygus lucorum]